jgi:hypothetical protein
MMTPLQQAYRWLDENRGEYVAAKATVETMHREMLAECARALTFTEAFTPGRDGVWAAYLLGEINGVLSAALRPLTVVSEYEARQAAFEQLKKQQGESVDPAQLAESLR